MRSIRANSRHEFQLFLALLGFLTLLTFFSLAQTYFENQSRGRSVEPGNIAWRVVYWYYWAAFAPLIFYMGRRFGPQRLRFSIPLHFLTSIIAGFGHTLAISLVSLSWMEFKSLRESLISSSWDFPFGVLIYCAILASYYLARYYRGYRERDLQAAELKAQLSQSQLMALRAQLHPHFLFNTLNSISALMYRDVRAANDMLSRLSDLLRISLLKSSVQMVTLEEELDFLTTYLEIEKIRFQDRLTIELSIDPEARDAVVPYLILQPLVENSVRHGIAKRRGPGFIRISASRQGEMLQLKIYDNGGGFPAEGKISFTKGVGLANTKTRLKVIYNSNQSLKLRNFEEGGAEVIITIPFSKEMVEADSSSSEVTKTD